MFDNSPGAIYRSLMKHTFSLTKNKGEVFNFIKGKLSCDHNHNYYMYSREEREADVFVVFISLTTYKNS